MRPLRTMGPQPLTEGDAVSIIPMIMGSSVLTVKEDTVSRLSIPCVTTTPSQYREATIAEYWCQVQENLGCDVVGVSLYNLDAIDIRDVQDETTLTRVRMPITPD